jgi:transcriptional regulator with XRE-family HTH domain
MVRPRPALKARQIFAGNLRRLRHAQGLSQDQLAHLAGVHRTYVGAVERCEKNISIDSIEKLALALGCPIHHLLEKTE